MVSAGMLGVPHPETLPSPRATPRSIRTLYWARHQEITVSDLAAPVLGVLRRQIFGIRQASYPHEREKHGKTPRTTAGPKFSDLPASLLPPAGRLQGFSFSAFRSEKREVTGSTPVPTTGECTGQGICNSEGLVRRLVNSRPGRVRSSARRRSRQRQSSECSWLSSSRQHRSRCPARSSAVDRRTREALGGYPGNVVFDARLIHWRPA
jgi:hypothetical protein